MTMDNENEINYERAKLFLERNIKVHIVKNNGVFYNGVLVEVTEKFIVINDTEEGNRTVFYPELNRPIEEYISRK